MASPEQQKRALKTETRERMMAERVGGIEKLESVSMAERSMESGLKDRQMTHSIEIQRS